MRVALITGPGKVEVRDWEPVVPRGTAVAVDVSLCGICGTDLGSYRSGSVHSPAVCGHEWVGTVTAVGDAVTEVRTGSRVVVAVPHPCGSCPDCQAGEPEQCAHVMAVSRGRDADAPAHGGFAERLVVDQTRVLEVPAELSDVEAAQLEPVAVALHGVRRAGVDAGDLVVVLGGGPIGLLAAQCARAVGAGTVVVVEPQPARRAVARELGADVAVEPDGATELVAALNAGRGADVVLECVGRPEALMTATGLARRGGTVLLLGFTSEDAVVRPGAWLSREVTVRGAVAFTRDDLARAVRLVADGRVRTAPLHSRTVGLDGLGDALADLASGGSGDLKVLVDPRLPA